MPPGAMFSMVPRLFPFMRGQEELCALYESSSKKMSSIHRLQQPVESADSTGCWSLCMLDTFFEDDSYKAQSSSCPRMKGNSRGTIENIAPGGISKSGIYHYDSSSA